MTRLAYLVTHPIQYQAPLLRRIAARPDVTLHVFFCSEVSVGRFRDPEFGTDIAWQSDLLEGYEHEFLPALGRRDRIDALRPLNLGLGRRLVETGTEVLWVHGYSRLLHVWAMWRASRRGIRVLLRDEATLVSRPRGPVRRMLKQAFFRMVDRWVDGYLAIGTLNRRYYRAHGVADDRIHDMPYSIDGDAFAAAATEEAGRRVRAALRLDDSRPTVLFVGKLIERKNPTVLIDAISRLPAERRPDLVFAGDGPLTAALQDRAAAIDGFNCRFPGFVPQEDLPGYYAAADLMVLPSRREAWGLVVNEAMACGLPVVVSDRVGAAPDLVRPGETGWIFASGSATDLTDVLRHTLSDRGQLQAAGAAARRRIAEWGLEASTGGLMAALDAVTATRNRREAP